MDYFATRDFYGYFSNSWMIDPDGDISKVLNAQNATVTMSPSGGAAQAKIFNLKQLDWKNIALPAMGYRNLDEHGKCLARLVRKVGRITHKGFSDHTVDVAQVPQVAGMMVALGIVDRTYSDTFTRGITQSTALQAYKPTYATMEDAITQLKNNPKATGFALCADVAVVMGLFKHNTFVLLWKDMEAAHSEDGVRWKLLSPNYKDSLERKLGKLNYV